jgi:hypothetical protein
VQKNLYPSSYLIKGIKKVNSRYIKTEKRYQIEAIMLIDKLKEITIGSDNSTNIPRVINNRSDYASQKC